MADGKANTVSTKDLEAALCGNDGNQLLEGKIVPPTVWDHLRKDPSVTVVIFGVKSSLSHRRRRRKSLESDRYLVLSKYIKVLEYPNSL